MHPKHRHTSYKNGKLATNERIHTRAPAITASDNRHENAAIGVILGYSLLKWPDNELLREKEHNKGMTGRDFRSAKGRYRVGRKNLPIGFFDLI